MMQEYTVGSIKKVDYSLIGLKAAGKDIDWSVNQVISINP
jgi:hypothetical protein